MPVPGMTGVPNRVPPLPAVTCGAPSLPMVTLVTPFLPMFNRSPLPRLMLLRILNPIVFFPLEVHTVVQRFFVILYDLYVHVEHLRNEVAISFVHLFDYRVFRRVDEPERGFASSSSLCF